MNPTRILSWIYLGRICLGGAFLLSLSADGFSPAAEAIWITVVLLAAGTFTAASYAYSRSETPKTGRTFLYAQVVFDALFLTGVVYLTGGQRSMFAPLYILVISAGALLLPI